MVLARMLRLSTGYVNSTEAPVRFFCETADRSATTPTMADIAAFDIQQVSK